MLESFVGHECRRFLSSYSVNMTLAIVYRPIGLVVQQLPCVSEFHDELASLERHALFLCGS